MNRIFKIYGAVFFIVIVLLALLEANKKAIVDWRKNFNPDEKSPFGLYVFNQEANKLFNNKLERSELSPYSYYKDNIKLEPHNILVIEKKFDRESWKKVLKQVSEGSDAMVFSINNINPIADTLGFAIRIKPYLETDTLKLTDVKFSRNRLLVDKFPEGQRIAEISKDTEILGTSGGKKLYANFISKKFGRGHIYIHTEPTVLTNYYLLKPDNVAYIQNVLSYLPHQNTIWFVDNKESVGNSPLSFILSKPALRYAWWLLLGGLLLFVVFNAKRKQRIVPIIEPLQNKSVDFVKSIGNLYLQEGDFHNMMAKKAQYFLNRVRTELMIDSHQLDDDFANRLQQKTSQPIEKIKEAITLIKKAQDTYSQVIKEDLIRMNKILDEILK